MKIIKTNDYEQMSLVAKEMVLKQLESNGKSVIIFPTGSTPKRMYDLLVKSFVDNKDDWSKIKAFNLDEYVGLPHNNSFSYHSYMGKNFYNHINIEDKNINIPDGLGDLNKNVLTFNESFKKAGQADLVILGIGKNGHIGFNEPGSLKGSTFRLVDLTKSTIKANAKHFNNLEDVPKQAMSMGIADILSAKKVIIMASGISKAVAIDKMINGAVSKEVPASFLQDHNDVTVIIDALAAKNLK